MNEQEFRDFMAKQASLTLEHLRAIRTDIAGLKVDVGTIKTDVLNVRKDLHKLSGELLRQEESIAGMAIQIGRINTRLGLNETPQ